MTPTFKAATIAPAYGEIHQFKQRNMGGLTVLRKLFSYAILAVTVLWLIFSYVPVSVVTMPRIAYPMAGSGHLFQYLLVGGFVLFLLLQIWLVAASDRFFHTADGRENEAAAEFGLKRTNEIFWTAIPLLMTIGLALACWQMWSSLVSS